MQNFGQHALRGLTLVSLCLGLLFARETQAETLIQDICHVKGQEDNTLVGLGLVVGLRGTGDGGDFLPTLRSLATAMQLMGSPIGPNGGLELAKARNVALVTVTAHVPASGARQGQRITCTVSSIGAAKSLEGGMLFSTPLQGPRPESARVFAIAEGPIEVDPNNSTTGHVHNGCQFQDEFFHPYVKDGKVTLVIDHHRAGFSMANTIAQRVNEYFSLSQTSQQVAYPWNQGNVVVVIPDEYRDYPVDFISQMLSLPIDTPRIDARVVVNSRAGTVVLSGDVEIGPVVVSHNSIVVEAAAGGNAPESFVPVGDPENAKLKDLLEALRALRVPTADVIEIIKNIERTGKLHGRLIEQ